MDIHPNGTLPANTRVKLVNARFADVIDGKYFPASTSLILQNGRIMAMPGIHGEPDGFPAELVIDRQGKAVIPGLFNTHCHLQFLERGEFRERQVAKNFSDCLERGVTNVRDTLSFDLQENRDWMEKMSRRDIQGPRIPPGHSRRPVRRYLRAACHADELLFFFVVGHASGRL